MLNKFHADCDHHHQGENCVTFIANALTYWAEFNKSYCSANRYDAFPFSSSKFNKLLAKKYPIRNLKSDCFSVNVILKNNKIERNNSGDFFFNHDSIPSKSQIDSLTGKYIAVSMDKSIFYYFGLEISKDNAVTLYADNKIKVGKLRIENPDLIYLMVRKIDSLNRKINSYELIIAKIMKRNPLSQKLQEFEMMGLWHNGSNIKSSIALGYRVNDSFNFSHENIKNTGAIEKGKNKEKVNVFFTQSYQIKI